MNKRSDIMYLETSRMILKEYKLGDHEWPALKRMLKKNNSIYDQ